MAEQTAQSALKLDVSTKLALERTRVAYERTLLAWVRTATSMITFGFSIYKFFQIELGGGKQNDRLIGPREFALLLVGIGLAALLLATLEYRQSIRLLQAQPPSNSFSLGVIVAALVAILGILALIAVIFQQ